MSQITGLQPFQSALTQYASTNVGTTPVTIISSMTTTANMIEIVDTSGLPLMLAITPPNGETPTKSIIVPPGGNGQVFWRIPAGSKITLQTFSGSASSGYNVINLYN